MAARWLVVVLVLEAVAPIEMRAALMGDNPRDARIIGSQHRQLHRDVPIIQTQRNHIQQLETAPAGLELRGGALPSARAVHDDFMSPRGPAGRDGLGTVVTTDYEVHDLTHDDEGVADLGRAVSATGLGETVGNAKYWGCGSFKPRACTGNEVVAWINVASPAACRSQCISWLNSGTYHTTETERCCDHQLLGGGSGKNRCRLVEGHATVQSSVKPHISVHLPEDAKHPVAVGASLCWNKWACGSFEAPKKCTGATLEKQWTSVQSDTECRSKCEDMLEKGLIDLSHPKLNAGHVPDNHVCCALETLETFDYKLSGHGERGCSQEGVLESECVTGQRQFAPQDKKNQALLTVDESSAFNNPNDAGSGCPNATIHAPKGCSVQSGGDWKPRWNRAGEANCPSKKYQRVCKVFHKRCRLYVSGNSAAITDAEMSSSDPKMRNSAMMICKGPVTVTPTVAPTIATPTTPTIAPATTPSIPTTQPTAPGPSLPTSPPTHPPPTPPARL